MKRPLSRVVALIAALIVASIPLRGDQPAGAKSSDKQTPMHGELDRLVGSWDAALTYYFGGKENHGKARCEAKWILDGHCVQQEYNSIFMGKPLTILQFLTYDIAKKKLVEVHMMSLDGGALMNEGESTDKGKVWKLAGPYVNPMTQKAATLHTVYTFEDADHFTLDWFLPDATGKETRSVHIAHTRQR